MAALTNSRNTPEMADGGRIRVLGRRGEHDDFSRQHGRDQRGRQRGSRLGDHHHGQRAKVIGRAEYVVNGTPAQNAVNNPGAAGALQIAVRKGVFMYAQDNSITAASVGSPCFALDDNNVTATDRRLGRIRCSSTQQRAR